jgi:5-methylcytosine-specific restriction endonuclease McrA
MIAAGILSAGVPEMPRVMTEQRRAAKRAYDIARYPEIREKAIAKAKAHYEANREAKKAAATARYNAKKEEILAKEKAKRLADIAADPTFLERETAAQKARRLRRLDHYKTVTNARARERRKENPEKHRQVLRERYWADPVKARAAGVAYAGNRRARKLAAGGEFTPADIAALFQKQHGNCAWCLKSLGNATPHIDHYMPLSLGGSNSVSNIRLLHRKCNMEKHASDPIEFGRRNGLLCW